MLTKTASPPAPAFLWPVRVYWEDTDAGGVVYYANYLKFCERARSEWLRSLGLDQQAMATRDQVLFVVSSAQVRYAAPARLDDLLEVSVAITQTGGASLDLLQEVRRRPPADPAAPGALLASAQVRVACVQAGSFRPVRLPAAVLEAVARGCASPAGGSAK
ncbi:tol-pal system-associated acyl-CoA thioesterase [Thiomonas sp.]|jgi:tol-pal system-associated acyl-CoA thioesterase|uniref:tol-pal system-associated acyl-CoA thioesterase n=1 Tax=Thiomonas sp. TaxID=2047785 RepID=UPI00258C3683|nr:tol-pal system-associated acyl-CoA thioesterase [Thiomonas sp.]